MSDLARTERLLNLLYTIQKSKGIQAKELALIFGRTTRTIQRDINDLRKLGFCIDSSTGAAGGFASRGAYVLNLWFFRELRPWPYLSPHGYCWNKWFPVQE